MNRSGIQRASEQVAGAYFFLAVIFAEVEEFEDIGMPGLEVDGKGAFAFAPALVDIAGRVVEDSQHGDDAVGGPVGAA